MNKIQIHKEGQATFIGVMLPIGSYYEPNNIKGVSHFIEHLCFKGNKKRTQKEINLAIERYGGDINAFTDTEITMYWAKIANQYKDIATDVITDLATKAIFPAKEIDKERKIIIQELNMYKDNPANYVYELANKNYYPKYNGFHLPIIGTEKSLSNINREEIIKFYKEHYKNPTLIIVGDVKNKKRIDTFNNNFPNYSMPTNYKKKIIEVRKDISQSNMLIMAEVYMSERSKLEKAILANLLSEVYNDMSGRLFSKVREKHNLVYRIHFSSSIYSNGNLIWNVELGLDKAKIDKAYDLIIKELIRPITKKELNIAVTKAIGSQALRVESLSYIASNIAYALRGNSDWEEYLFNYADNIKKYSKDINNFLKEMRFKDNIMAGITPEK